MRNILLYFSILFLFVNISNAQTQNYGIPFIKNHGIKEYNALGPNWAIIKDKRGVMYFANDGGVLEYDGVNWNLIKLKVIARSLAIDSLGIIYVGADNEFGFIQPDNIGELYYTSLSDSLNEDLKDFSEINSIFTSGDGTFFCSRERIYKYHKNKMSVIELNKGSFISFYINDILYSGDYFKGLQKIVNDSVILCKNGTDYEDKDIFGMIPYGEDELLMYSESNEFYIYNTKTGNSRKPDFSDITILEEILNEYKLYINSLTKTDAG